MIQCINCGRFIDSENYIMDEKLIHKLEKQKICFYCAKRTTMLDNCCIVECSRCDRIFDLNSKEVNEDEIKILENTEMCSDCNDELDAFRGDYCDLHPEETEEEFWDHED